MKMKIIAIILLILYTPICFANTLEIENSVFETESTEYINEFTINIAVPIDKEVSNNILFVFDGSTVNNTTWINMKNAIVDCVNEILPYDEKEKNNNSVGFLSFGISGHVTIPLTSDKEEFISNLSDTTSNLLVGRSSSNNETGLRSAKEYLSSLPKEQKKNAEHTIVIYMSDGAVNMSDKLVDYYKMSIDGSKYGGVAIVDYQISLLQSALISLDLDSSIKRVELLDNLILEIRKLYTSINNLEELDNTTSLDVIINSISTTDEYQNLMKEAIKNLYEFMEYDFSKSYSAGDFESMMIKANFIEDSSINANFLDVFYIPMIAVKYDKVESSNRAVEEGMRLKEISTIYTVAYNSGTTLSLDYANKIMNPHFEGKGSYTSNVGNHFSEELYFANIKEITAAIKSLTNDVNKTNYKSLVMSGYTSKWVDPMDVNNDGVFNENDVVVVTGYKEGEKPNIKIVKVTEEELKQIENVDITSNDNGDIYKIYWEVTDDLKAWDQFKIAYKVKLDEKEPGFEYGKKYNANESFELNYTQIEVNDSGVEEEKPVKVELAPPTIKYDKEIEIINPDTRDSINNYFTISIISIFGILFSLYLMLKNRNAS